MNKQILQFLRRGGAWGLALLLSACASTDRRLNELMLRPPNGVAEHRITAVPFIEQKEAQCGPATLAMVLKSHGESVGAEDLLSQVFAEGKKGSLQSSLIAAARRRGYTAIVFHGPDALFREVAANHPAIVFENVGWSWYPEWHYAVVTGYDLVQKKIYLHSGPQQNRAHDLFEFNEEWRGGEQWGLLVLKPNELAATGSELDHVGSAAVLEKIGKITQAEQAYQAVLTRWPESLGARIGLGNMAFAAGQAEVAVKVLKEAVQFHPGSTTARHNLEIAEKAVQAKRKK